MVKCDCYIGVVSDGEWAQKSTISRLLYEEYLRNKDIMSDKKYKDIWKIIGKRKSVLEYIDKRLISMFIYCPSCGTKISWKRIRNKIKTSKFKPKTFEELWSKENIS